jgi:regulator of RNase E activity RraA
MSHTGGQATGRPRSAELHPGPGFRIRHDFEVSDRVVLDGFRGYATPEISDLMNRLYTIDPGIHNLTDPDLRIVAPACTVKVFPGDNLMVHKSLDVARAGDVVVVDAGGTSLYAVLGDLISTKARHREIAGFVVDGRVRDIARIRALGDFPVFARGVTPIGPLHRGPGEINYPVSVGGIVVHAGDIIVADIDGVVVVPQELARDILRRLDAQAGADAEYVAAVRRGEFSNAWVDAVLSDAGIDGQEE